MHYCGYRIPQVVFDYLHKHYPPKYDKVIGHHITEHLGMLRENDILRPREIVLTHYVDSEDGIEAFVARVDNMHVRPDRSTYHLTWSLEQGKYKPVDSNNLVNNKKGEPIIFPVLQFYASLEQF